MDNMQIQLAKVIEGYFGADAGYLDISCLDLAKRILDAGWTKPEWISVNDRLPKTGERVLVCIGAVFEAFIDDDGKWQRYYSAPLNEVLGEPTHWMPLPNRRKENDYV